jgi:hypothetical protein
MMQDLENAEMNERVAMLQLLSAVLGRYYGDPSITQDELDGYVCRYGAAVHAHRELLQKSLTAIVSHNNQLLN